MKKIKVIEIERESASSCSTDEKGSSCCSPAPAAEAKDMSVHWDKVYAGTEEKLGWYETDLAPTVKLIKQTNLSKGARILNVGAGSTTLVDELLSIGFDNIIATDISEKALKNLESRVGDKKIVSIIDDLTNPKALNNIEPVDLWVDRAVLHFFTEAKDQDTYFNLLKEKLASGGFVIFAEYNINGAIKCAGLDVHRYSKEMLVEKLGNDFTLVDSFEHTYTMPSGDLRPYVYTLFQRI